MYVWSNPTRRERRSRKHDQFQPYLSDEQIEAFRLEDEEQQRDVEINRRMLEKRELQHAMQFIRPEIEKYLKTGPGKKEIRQVMAEMKRLKKVDALEHPPEEAVLEQLKELERENPDIAGDPHALKELQKRQHVKDIFEVFDGDASDAMDAEELKELLTELCLPCTDDDVAELMVVMDQDRSGEIDFEEFYDWYSHHKDEMTKGHMIQSAMMSVTNMVHQLQDLQNIGEAKRIIVSHCEHEARERALRQFRLFRPPDAKALAESDNPEDHETPEEVERRRHRFAPITNLLYADTKEGRSMRLGRLAFSSHLYEPKTTLDDLPIIQPSAAPSIGDGGTGRRLRQWRNGQCVEGLDARVGKRAGAKTRALGSVRSALAKGWHMTRTMHPTFTAVKLSGTGRPTEDTTAGNRLGVGGTPYADDPGRYLDSRGGTADPNANVSPPLPGGGKGAGGEDFGYGFGSGGGGGYSAAQRQKLEAVEKQMADDALQRQRARGGGQRGGKKRGRFMLAMPLLDKPFTAKLLQRENRNNPRLRVSNLQNYPARSVMRRTVEPAMSDLLARLAHDAVELPRGAMDVEFIPVGEQKAPVKFVWSDVVEQEARLCIEGWGRDGTKMVADNVSQEFFLELHLPAGRYTYRYQIDGFFVLDPDKAVTTLERPKDEDLAAHFREANRQKNKNAPSAAGRDGGRPATAQQKTEEKKDKEKKKKKTAEELAAEQAEEIAAAKRQLDAVLQMNPDYFRRNVMVVAPHSTEPEDDAHRAPVTAVSLPQKQLSDDGVWVLKEALRFNRSVKTLDLPTNGISSAGCCALGGLLGERPAMITRLNLSSNGCGRDACLALAMGLKKNHSLRSLELSKNRVGDDGLDALSGGLEGHRFLQNVELASNFVHDDGVEDLCRGLLLNNSVCRIGLADNCVGPRGVSALCSCLRTNQTVRDVDLSRNPLIGAEGAAFMGRYLEDRDCRLECLLMSQTTLCAGETDKKGVFGMAQGLKKNQTVHTLALADNGITNWGARELAVALQCNVTLVSLDLDSNFFDDEWLRPAHTLHTEMDPSIRSIASCVLRNGELSMVPQNVRRWEHGGSLGGAPGMLVANARYTKGGAPPQAYDSRGRAATGNAPGLGHPLYGVEMKEGDGEEGGGLLGEEDEDEDEDEDGGGGEGGAGSGAGSRTEYNEDGSIRIPEYPRGTIIVAAARKERRYPARHFPYRKDQGLANARSRDAVMAVVAEDYPDDESEQNSAVLERRRRRERRARKASARKAKQLKVHGEDDDGDGDGDGGDFVGAPSPARSDASGGGADTVDPNDPNFEPRDDGKWVPRGKDEKTGEELPPHWLNFKEQARKAAEIAEALAYRQEKERIEDENRFILAARLKAREECKAFIDGTGPEASFGPQLIASLATNVLEADRKKRDADRAEEKARLERMTKSLNREQGLVKIRDFAHRTRKEDVRSLFESFDEDCSDSIDAEELSTIMINLGVPLKPFEVDELIAVLDTDKGGDVDFEEFWAWYEAGGMDELMKGKQMGAALLSASNFVGGLAGGDSKALKDQAERYWTSVFLHKAEQKARSEFRNPNQVNRPPRRGCVCPTTGMAFPEAAALAEHKRKFDFPAFQRQQRAYAGRERLLDRAREAMTNGVPEYPRVMCFSPEVPKYIELTAYDVADTRMGRPVGTIRHTDVVRCLSGDASGWIRIMMSGTPEAWVLNKDSKQPLKYPEILIPMDIGESPGDDGVFDDSKVEVDATAGSDDEEGGKAKKGESKKEKERARRKFEKERQAKRLGAAKKRKKGAPPKTAITFFDAGDPNAIKQWFTPDPYLPEGARLKVRDRPEDDADVVSGVDLGYAVQVICNARDWVMVVYMETVEDPNKRMQFKDVRREGWMLLRTSRRTLLVPVQDPEVLEIIGNSEVSPVLMPEIKHSDSEDSDEELTPEQKKELKLRQRAANKKRMKKQAQKAKERREIAEERSRLMASGDKDAIAHALSEHMGKVEESAAREERMQAARENPSDSDSD